MTQLHIGALKGGGLILGYRCSARCRHCVYACGPHRRDGDAAGEDGLRRVLERLSEVAPRVMLHIGGGEPFLDLERLEHVIYTLKRRRLRLDYVETNASWARTPQVAGRIVSQLLDAGLDMLMVSMSPFHGEYVPLERTIAAVEAADQQLPRGALVWIRDFWPELSKQDQGRRYPLTRLIEETGATYAVGLTERYRLVPGGRAGRFLYQHGARAPWDSFTDGEACRSRLADTSHFHVDLDGHYVPGLCAGIQLPLAEVPGEIDLDRYQVLATLIEGGASALARQAAAQGFRPNGSYSSACDLCGHARAFLVSRGGRPELGPSGFYDPRSITWTG